MQLGAAEHGFQGDGDLHLSGEVGVVELVGVADAFVGLELHVGAAEGVAAAGGEVGEGHAVAAAFADVAFMHGGGEAEGRQPFDHGVRVGEGAVEAALGAAQDAVQADGLAGHGVSPLLWIPLVERRIRISTTGPSGRAREHTLTAGPSPRGAARTFVLCLDGLRGRAPRSLSPWVERRSDQWWHRPGSRSWTGPSGGASGHRFPLSPRLLDR